MNKNISRREFSKLVAGTALASTLGSRVSWAQDKNIRLIWWGNPERDKRTYAVVDKFMASSDIEVLPETYSWGDYWQKLATQAAGRNLPDLIQMDYRYIYEYARRGQLADLDAFMGKELTLDDFDANQLQSGRVDGKLYGVSLGANSMTHVYNKRVADEIGFEFPDSTKWTTDDYVSIGKQLKDKLPEGMYFSENMGHQESRLQTWVRSRGKDLYTPEGKLGYELEDLVGYFDYWKMMQDEGLTPPADVQAQDSGKMEERMHVIGKSLVGFIHSNQLVGNQNLMDDEIELVMIPSHPGGKPGQYMKPSMFMSMAAGSSDQSSAAKLLNYFVTNDDANDILLIERGVSGDASIRERILPDLTATEQKIINYLDTVSTWVGELPSPPPQNAGELDRALRPAWESVAFGKVEAENAAKEYHDNAVRILDRV